MALRIADRKYELGFLDAMLRGKNSERIFLIRAPSESGKSVLLAEFAEHASVLLGSRACARINLKAEPPLSAVLDRICVDLGRQNFPKFCSTGSAVPVQMQANLPRARFGNDNIFKMESHVYQAQEPSSLMLASNLIADLSVRVSPCVLIIDTFEQATAETSNWIIQQLLPLVRSVDLLWMVIAGKTVPRADEYTLEWGDLAKSHELSPVTSTDDWHEYACRRYPNFPRQYIEVICRGLTSRPSAIEEFIRVAGSGGHFLLGGPL